jgi:hypothetical protein
MMMMIMISPFGRKGGGRFLQGCEMYSHQSRMFSHYTPPALRSPNILLWAGSARSMSTNSLGWHSIGQTERIRSSVSSIQLVNRRIYSCGLAFDWSCVEHILMGWHSIGHMGRIGSRAGILLITHKAYSHGLAFYWSHIKHILMGWHSIGHRRRWNSLCMPAVL